MSREGVELLGNQCLRAGAIVVLVVAIAAAAAVVPGAVAAQGEGSGPALFFYNFKQKVELEYDAETVAVRHGSVPVSAVLEDLLGVVPDLEVHEELGEWTLFGLPSASATIDGSVAESVLVSIASLASDLGEKYFFSPLFGSQPYRSLLNGRVIVGFEEDEVPEFAEQVLADAGIGIHERHFAEMRNVYRGEVVGARSGLEVLEVANALAELDFVRWSEPSFTELGGASSYTPPGSTAPPAVVAHGGVSLGLLVGLVVGVGFWLLRPR